MSVREAFSWISVDVDGCSLTFGTGACTAALGVDGVTRKCFNTFNTCRKPTDYSHMPVYRTMRYCQPRSNMPKGATFFPLLVGDPSEHSATVNIAGSDGDLSAFGRRATISARFIDAPDHDRYFDKYQAERVSGAAQLDGIGYPPVERGTHFAKLKSRWPFYAGRPMRRHDGYIVNGQRLFSLAKCARGFQKPATANCWQMLARRGWTALTCHRRALVRWNTPHRGARASGPSLSITRARATRSH